MLEPELEEYRAHFETTRDMIDGHAAVQLALETMLQSPSFVYRTEIGVIDEPLPALGERVSLTKYEVASFLSFALWGEAPDDEIYDIIESEETPDYATLAMHMMDDARFVRGFDDFIGGLLELDALESASPAVGYEAEWDVLREHMRAEPRAFVSDLFFGDGESSFAQLFTADYNFADSTLAPLYEASVEGDEFVRVDTGGRRPGVLG